MHERVVLGVKGVLFREVSSFQEYPHRERASICHKLMLLYIHPHNVTGVRIRDVPLYFNNFTYIQCAYVP